MGQGLSIPLVFHTASGLWNLGTLIVLFVIVFQQAPASAAKRALLGLLASAGFWSLFYALWTQAKSVDQAFLFEKFFTLGALFSMSFTLNFAISLFENEKFKWTIPCTHILAALIALINAVTPWYIQDYAPLESIAFYPRAGWFHPISLLYLGANIGLSLYVLWGEAQSASQARVQQAKYMMVAISLSWLAGSSTYFGFYSIPIPPVLTALVSGFIGFFVFASMKHKLLDVEVVARRGVVFVSLVAMAALFVFGFIHALPQWLLARWNFQLDPALFNFFAFTVGFFAFKVLHARVTDWTDQTLFQKDIDHQKVIGRVVSATLKAKTPNAFAEAVVSEIKEGLRLQSVTYFALAGDSSYRLVASEGSVSPYDHLDPRTALKCLAFVQQPAGFGIRPPRHQMPDLAFDELRLLTAEIALPIMRDREMTGIVFLGRRLSEKAFSYEDMDYLVPLNRILSAVHSNSILREELKMAQEKVLEAHHDKLTGALTRAAFSETAEVEFIRARHFNRQFSILMTDLDLFKSKNDTYGHQVGDEILAEAASRMRQSLRGQDIFGRYGGEEFVIFLGGASRLEAIEVAERIRERLGSKPFKVSAGEVSQTVSIGVASFPAEGQTIDELIRKADSCLYGAKHKGRNCVMTDADLAQENRKARVG